MSEEQINLCSILVYAGASFIYGGVKRATAPPAPVEPAKPAPVQAAPAAAATISAAGLEGGNTVEILKDIQTRVSNIEKLLQ